MGQLQVIPVNPKGKQILIIKDEVDPVMFVSFQRALADFMQDPTQSIMILNGWQIEKVDTDDVQDIRLTVEAKSEVIENAHRNAIPEQSILRR